jgi:Tfp pilus assembly protein PilF
MRAMKKLAWGFAAAAVLAAVVVWIGLVRVPPGKARWAAEGDAFRKLGPGFHWVGPRARGAAPEAREFSSASKGTLHSCEYVPLPFAARGVGRFTLEFLETRPAGDRVSGERAAEALRAAFVEAGLTLRLEEWADPAKRPLVEERVRDRARRRGFALSRLEWEVDAGAVAAALGTKGRVRALTRPPRPVLFIGLDAADWMILDRLMARGALPNLAALKARSAWADIVSEEPMLSPILWTSIATGKRPEKHGILEFTTRDPATGRELPVTADKRRVKALWNILSAFGRRTAVLGWWATHPAEWVDGVLVSERVGYQLFGLSGAFADAPGLVSPFPTPAPAAGMTRAADVGFDRVRPLVNVSRAEFDRAWEEGARAKDPFADPLNHLRAILASTGTVRDLALDLLRRGPWDLMAPYFEGTDTAGHRFAQYLPPRPPWVDASEFARYSGTLDAYYALIDGVVGDLVRAFPADGYVLIASDHGFKTGASRPQASPEDMVLGAPQWHRKFGVFMLAGPGVRRGRAEPVSILDLAPLVLYLQGMPLARDMDGRLPAVFEASTLADRPPAFIATYEEAGGRPATPAAAPDAAMEERMKELQALGYIGGGGGPAPAAPGGGGEEGSYTAWYNLANAAMYRGEGDKAKEFFLKALGANPSFGLAMFHLASLEARSGNHAEAVRWLDEAMRVGREVPALAAVHLVDEARLVGRVPEALEHLRALEGKYGGAAAYHSAVGIALLHQRRESEAHEAFGRALALDPTDPYAIEEDLRLAARTGRPTPAEAALQAALRDPAVPFGALRDLGKACLRLGLVPEAEALLSRALASDDSDPELLLYAAMARQQGGRSEEAERLFRKALVAGPFDPRVHFNYGAALANGGRLTEAHDHLRRAEQYGMRDPALYNALAKVAFRLGKRGEAAEWLERSLAMAPDQPEVREMLDALGGPPR